MTKNQENKIYIVTNQQDNQWLSTSHLMIDNYYPSNIDNPLSTKLKKKTYPEIQSLANTGKTSDYKTIFANHYMFTVCQ
jgi:hypothetical protein